MDRQILVEILHDHRVDYFWRATGVVLDENKWNKVPVIWQKYYLEAADIAMRFFKSRGKYTKYKPLNKWIETETSKDIEKTIEHKDNV